MRQRRRFAVGRGRRRSTKTRRRWSRLRDAQSGVHRRKSRRRRDRAHCNVCVRMVHNGPTVSVASRRGRVHRVRRERRLPVHLSGIPHGAQRSQVSPIFYNRSLPPAPSVRVYARTTRRRPFPRHSETRRRIDDFPVVFPNQ